MSDLSELRRKAEALLAGGPAKAFPAEVDVEQMRRLLHELEVNQAELEMQNDELLRAQVELQAARDRWFELYDLAPVGYLTLDEVGVVLGANLQGARLLGAERARVIGRSLPGLVAGEDRPAIDRHLREVFTGEERRSCEVRLLRPDGTRRHVRIDSTAAREGASLRCRTILVDVSEQRAAEDLLRWRERELLHLQRLESLGRLAAHLAHEYRNLLQGLQGGVERARDGALACSAAHGTACPAQEPLGELEGAAERGSRLVEQVLALARREGGERQPVRLDQVVKELERLIEGMLGRRVGIQLELGAPEAWVLAGPGWLEHVLLNLAGNARDAMPFGGRLHVRTRWEGQSAPRRVVLSVKDTGTGMSQEVLARAFEPFFTTKPGGTGLGLSTIRDLVVRMEGRVMLESTPGEGTTVRLALPACSPPGEGDAAPPVRTRRARILVAEDERLILLAVEHYLAGTGHEPLLAADAPEALELARLTRAPIDLLLADLSLPGGGPELARAVRELHPGVRVLYMSGFSRAQLLEQGAIDPAAESIQKPFSAHQLTTRIDEVLQSSPGAPSCGDSRPNFTIR